MNPQELNLAGFPIPTEHIESMDHEELRVAVRLLAEGVNRLAMGTLVIGAGEQSPSADTQINSVIYVQLTGIAFDIRNPVEAIILVIAELKFNITTAGTLLSRLVINGRNQTAHEFSLDSAVVTPASSIVFSAPVETSGPDGIKTISVQCKAENSGDFDVLDTSSVRYIILPYWGGEGV